MFTDWNVTGRSLYMERRPVAQEVELSADELVALEGRQAPERIACFEQVESGLAVYF